jgi:ferrous iron transport protein B
LVEVGLPVVVALNMMDVVRKSGDTINAEKLSRSLGCVVAETSAARGEGLRELAELAVKIAREKKAAAVLHEFGPNIEKAIGHIEKLVLENVSKENAHWFAVKLFERDEKVLQQLSLPEDLLEKIEAIITGVEDEEDDDAESIIANARYNYIGELVQHTVKKKARGGLSRYSFLSCGVFIMYPYRRWVN